MNLQLEIEIQKECTRLFEKYPRMFPKGMPTVTFYSQKPRGRAFRLATASNVRNEVRFNVHTQALGGKTKGEWIDTAAHEMAHIATPGEIHGRMWKLTARIFGVNNPSHRANGIPTPREIVYASPLPPALQAYSLPRVITDPTTGKVMNPHVQEQINASTEVLIGSSN